MPSMDGSEEVPPWLGTALAWTAVFLPALAAAAIVLIGAGVFDPRPVGQPAHSLSLAAAHVPAESAGIQWLAAATPTLSGYSARLVAAHQSGELDIAYGLALGRERHVFVAAVSPLGYVAVWEERDGATLYHLPWQTWPHVKTGSEPNEIRIDNQAGQITVRLNRELLWRGEVALRDEAPGLFSQSFGDAAVIDFRALYFFTVPRQHARRAEVAGRCR
jgi:hypothetical protein